MFSYKRFWVIIFATGLIMKRKLLVIIAIILTVSLLTGCDELFDVNTIIERNPFIPTEGTPVPAPNAPLIKTPIPTVFEPTTEPTPDSTETPVPLTSTNPKPAPTTQPPVTAVPTSVPTAEPTIEPTPEPTLIPPVVDLIPKIGFLTDDSDNAAYALSAMAWNELEHAALDFGYEPVFIELPAMDDGTILAYIDILVKDECEMIILPSYRFKGALTKAQTLYPDTYFVLIEFNGILGDNVVTVVFSEFQAGFIAGVAAATELSSQLGLETTDFGIIVGENSLSVELYSAGFTEGLNYAANMYGIGVSLSTQFIHYLTDPTDIEEAIYAAYGLFDSGVECILNLAGPSASGVISAAVDAVQWEIPAYVVGVDYDSYLEGLYNSDLSVVLTSAVKYYGTAVYRILESFTMGDFPGGTKIMFDYYSGGVGLPLGNLGFSIETIDVMTYVFEQMDLNWLVVPPLGDSPIMILAPPPIPAPSEIPTLPPIPSETPTVPPLPSATPTIPPLPSSTPTIPPLP